MLCAIGWVMFVFLAIGCLLAIAIIDDTLEGLK